MVKKNNYILLIITLFFLGCKEKPTFCEATHNIDKIILTPINRITYGKKVTIENDSLIQFITDQICNPSDIYWRSGHRGEGEVIQIEFIPPIKDLGSIYVVNLGLSSNHLRYREGLTYFKNDILCESIFLLCGLEHYLISRGLRKPIRTPKNR